MESNGLVNMNTAIVLFRKILRIHDNPLLEWASKSENFDSIIPIYIMKNDWLKDNNQNLSPNRKKFQYESIIDLNKSLVEKYDSELLIFNGNSLEIIESLCECIQGKKILLTDYCSNPENRTIEDELKYLSERYNGFNYEIFPAINTILDIEKTTKSDVYRNPKSMQDMHKIFDDFFEKYPSGHVIEPSIDNPQEIYTDKKQIKYLKGNSLISKLYIPISLIEKSIPNVPKSYFIGGETEALKRFRTKISNSPDYVKEFRKPSTISTNVESKPMEPTTTGLSPYISTGCISVRLVWNECMKIYSSGSHSKPPESLIGQLMFREMFYLLSRSVNNWDNDTGNSNCKQIKWGEYDKFFINAWEEGNTGFPYIDAMMRQLNSTGWMHHLGRHAVSCFLTRGQLWQNWKYGRDIFERKLVDSDWAINNGNWLWLAGVAPFSMPYYRIYNPCPDSKSSLNAETERANFIRHWVPELAKFPSKHIFEPHLAPIGVQNKSGCVIGKDYPNPIIDRKKARKENISNFKNSLNNISNNKR